MFYKPIQEFNNSTPMEREITARKFIRQVFDNIVTKTYRENPMKGTPMEGYAILNAINKTNEYLVNDISSLSTKYNLPNNTIKRIIQEVSRDVHDDFFEN